MAKSKNYQEWLLEMRNFVHPRVVFTVIRSSYLLLSALQLLFDPRISI